MSTAADNVYATVKYQAFEERGARGRCCRSECSRNLRRHRDRAASASEDHRLHYANPVPRPRGLATCPARSQGFCGPSPSPATFGIQVPDAEGQWRRPFAPIWRLPASFSLQYSLKYLQGNVEYVGLPPLIGRLIPVVEFTYSAPVSRAFGNAPTGLVAPGIIYSDNGLQFGVEALLPINRSFGHRDRRHRSRPTSCSTASPRAWPSLSSAISACELLCCEGGALGQGLRQPSDRSKRSGRPNPQSVEAMTRSRRPRGGQHRIQSATCSECSTTSGRP